MRQNIRVWSFVALLGIWAAPAAATDRTFTPATGVWDFAGNWDPDDNFPQASDRAIIPDKKTCHIVPARAETADSIDVQSGGRLEIQADSTSEGKLTISEDSTVDGELVFLWTEAMKGSCSPEEDPGILHIADTLTITGGGGTIRGGCRKDLLNPGLITGAAGKVLTLSNYGLQKLTAKNNLYFEVELVNNAVVTAGENPFVLGEDDRRYVVTLALNPKSGSGQWSAYTGELHVDVALSGSGDLFMRRVGLISVIRINAACSSSLDVGCWSGAFDVQEDFCTTGSFVLSGQGVVGNEGPLYVNVANGKALDLAACSCP